MRSFTRHFLPQRSKLKVSNPLVAAVSVGVSWRVIGQRNFCVGGRVLSLHGIRLRSFKMMRALIPS